MARSERTRPSRPFNIVAAHEHDIRAIGVLWASAQKTAGADELAHTPAELAALLAP
jgi:hypothetical protein